MWKLEIALLEDQLKTVEQLSRSLADNNEQPHHRLSLPIPVSYWNSEEEDTPETTTVKKNESDIAFWEGMAERTPVTADGFSGKKVRKFICDRVHTLLVHASAFLDVNVLTGNLQ